jgi:rRNA pseudouridine-1189 N-methylase Emg1 (Nep1/Mra1 family)
MRTIAILRTELTTMTPESPRALMRILNEARRRKKRGENVLIKIGDHYLAPEDLNQTITIHQAKVLLDALI